MQWKNHISQAASGRSESGIVYFDATAAATATEATSTMTMTTTTPTTITAATICKDSNEQQLGVEAVLALYLDILS